MSALLCQAVVLFLKVTTSIYDLLTFPIYVVINPIRRRLRAIHRKEKPEIIQKSDKSITLRYHGPKGKLHYDLVNNDIDTGEKLFSYAIKRFGKQRCLGTRKVVEEKEFMGPDGKIHRKLELGTYSWMTYEQVGLHAKDLGKGMRSIGVEPGTKICIFGETRANWLISAIAAIQQSYTVVTLYATLGEEGVIHGLNQTECELVIASKQTFAKIWNNLEATPTVKNIIIMEDEMPTVRNSTENVKLFTFPQVMDMGRRATIAPAPPPKPDDTAIIMYTSGSTGNPKGVMLSQANLVSGTMGFLDGFREDRLTSKDVYIAYLPLAHIFEMAVETLYFWSGVPIGYSNPLTLFDGASMLAPGCKGDATVLKPTITMMVPLMLDRLYKAVTTRVAKRHPVVQAVYHFFYDYKLKWYQKGFSAPLVDRYIFYRVRNVLGGRVRFIGSGSAPLAPVVHEYMRNILGCTLSQGYGLTETTANTCFSTFGDTSLGRVGRPLITCNMRLIDWEEGGYRVVDKPRPRGEICIGGPSITQGYYKLPEITASDFFVDEYGMRWFKSGDIGELHEDSIFAIIDRKKDLVKLQMGEYISLAKIEGAIKSNPIIEVICVYADSRTTSCIALVLPNSSKLLSLADELGKSDLNFEEACQDPEIVKHVLTLLQKQAKAHNLLKYEIPAALFLVSDMWTPDTGLVTAAMKLRRRNIQEYYQKEIDHLYKTIA